MKTSWLPREGFVEYPRRRSGKSSSQRLRDGFTKTSRRDHYGEIQAKRKGERGELIIGDYFRL